MHGSLATGPSTWTGSGRLRAGLLMIFLFLLPASLLLATGARAAGTTGAATVSQGRTTLVPLDEAARGWTLKSYGPVGSLTCGDPSCGGGGGGRNGCWQTYNANSVGVSYIAYAVNWIRFNSCWSNGYLVSGPYDVEHHCDSNGAASCANVYAYVADRGPSWLIMIGHAEIYASPVPYGYHVGNDVRGEIYGW